MRLVSSTSISDAGIFNQQISQDFAGVYLNQSN